MKTKTKILLFTFIAIIAVLLIVPNATYASTEYMSGDYTYTVDNQKAKIIRYEGSNAEVKIPSKLGKYPVTEIGYRAFENCQEIETITIPASITKIDDTAFYDCNFTKVIFDKNCKISTISGFDNMSNLTSITMPNYVKTIGYGAFAEDANLTAITIPASVQTIKGDAFKRCTGLTTISIPKNVAEIADDAFYGCNFTKVIFANDCKITTIAGFGDMSNLTSINIPNNVKTIGYHAFAEDTNLKTITIPASVQTIQDNAFKRCTGLTTINIPTNVSQIGDDAFYGCNFTKVTFANDCKITKIAGFRDMSKLTSINIPNNVKTIGYSAFENDTNLKQITIPSSVQTIQNNAFKRCTGLTTITIPRRVEEIGEDTFYACENLKSIAFADDCMITKIPCFSSIPKLASINIPRSVNIIQYSAFENNTGLTTIKIPSSVKEIQNNAFKRCSNMTVEIPKSVTSIGEDTFYGVSNITVKCEAGSYAYNFLKGKSGITCITTTFPTVTAPINISKCSISGYGAKSYTGKPITANLAVKYNGKALTYGTDYIAEYENNTNIGIAKITIVGFGKYIGKVQKTFKIIPATVTGVTYTNPSTTSITLKWTPNKGNITGYRVYLYNSSSKSYKQIGTTKAASYKITNLKAATTYKYAIKAYSDISGSTYTSNAYSSIFTVSTSPATPKVSAKPESTTKIKLSWKKITGATGYEIYQYNTSNKKYEKVATTQNTNYTVSKLKAGTTYKFIVKAYRTVGGKNYYSANSKVITTGTKTKTPTISKVVAGSKKATVKWKKVSGASGYEVYMATSKNGKYKKVGTTTKNNTVSYTQKKLTKGKKYYFKIRTYKKVDGKKIYSSYSNIKNVKVK